MFQRILEESLKRFTFKVGIYPPFRNALAKPHVPLKNDSLVNICHLYRFK